MTPVSEYEWLDVAAGDHEIGLRPDEARAFAELAAREAREAAEADPDLLHPEREARQLAEMWGNPDYLYGQLAFAMPAHRVVLPRFSITKTPVTLAHYTQFRLATGASPRATYSADVARPTAPDVPTPSQPVTGISWTEAAVFASWASAELPAEAMWEVAFRRGTSPFGRIGHELYEWCIDEFAAYPGADKVAVGRIEAPPGGWWGTRTRRGGVIPGFPVSAVTRSGADPNLKLRDTTFRLVRR